MSTALQGWTQGVEAISYQRCASCGQVQYLERPFCATCGSRELTQHTTSGNGVVYATSLVHRAPTPDIRAHGPYNIVLVDMAEGFRMMAHGAPDLAIGEAVSAEFRQFVGTLVPFFKRTSS